MIRVPVPHLAGLVAEAKSSGFEMCSDITAVDYRGIKRVRYELVINLLSLSLNRRLRVLAAGTW